MSTTEVVVCRTAEELAPWVGRWDDLAVALSAPTCAPVVMLAWWRASATPATVLHVVLLVRAEELVGVAAFASVPRRLPGPDWRLAGAERPTSVSPLARPGFGEELGRAIGRSFGDVRPRPGLLAFEDVDAAANAGLVAATARAWPGPLPARARHDLDMVAPVVLLDGGSHAAWIARKSKNFRHKEKQARRAAEKAGATVRRCTTAEELEADLASFARLHDARWDWRGGSKTTVPEAMAWFGDIARELLPLGRLWLYLLEIDGRAIGAYFAVSAGTVVHGVALGFDGEHAAMRPGHQLMHAIIADASDAGLERFDLGPGPLPYKVRFGDVERPMAWWTVIPRGRHWPVTRARTLPKRARERAVTYAASLPPERKAQLKRLVRREAPRPPTG